MKASVRFLYHYCNDLAAIRRFYSDLLQLDECYFVENESVAYRCDALQFSFSQVEQPLPIVREWAVQPGWRGGTLPVASWSVEYDEETFRKAVTRLKADGIVAFHPDPQWQGYWSYPVRDPMGNTVELSFPDGPPDWRL